MSLEKLLTVDDVAELLGLSIHTVYSWVSQRRLPFIKIGTRTMFRPVEIERWLEEQSAPKRSQ